MLALLTDEQQMLREVVADLSARIGVTNPADLESLDRTRGWTEIASMGLLGLRLREGERPVASGIEVMLAAEQLAQHLVPQPHLGASLLPAELLALTGSCDELLKHLSTGEVRACVLFSSDLRSFAPDPLARPVAWDCEGAEVALSVDQEAGIVAVHPVTSLARVESVDLTRSVAEVVVGPADTIRPIGPAALDRWLAFALVAITADLVGAMRGGLNGAVDYTKDRMQFGVPVGSFQAIQHLCADAAVRIEGAASTVRYAAWGIDELEPPEALLAARTAKAYASSVAREVGEATMQVYGGIGQTWAHGAHLHLRRGLLSAAVLGDERVQLAAIADARLGTI